MSVVEDAVARKTASLWPHLDERQRRLVLGAEARELGRGGVKQVAAAAGVSPDTVAKGLRELESGAAPTGRVRRPGGGRKPLTATDPGLMRALEALVAPVTRGDPMSALRWTSKSTRTLAEELTQGPGKVDLAVTNRSQAGSRAGVEPARVLSDALADDGLMVRRH